jgi:NAD(P)-dependent dehydrogenase (short-subunit alcohol dehydrogenase family)
MATPVGTTEEGYESQFGTNHMGHALLTKLLMPTLLKTAEEPNSDVRIVNLSSEGHNMAPKGGIIFDNEELMKQGAWARYGNSKLANLLFAKGLAKRYPQITSVAVHPGIILTDLYNAQNEGSAIFRYGIQFMNKLFFTKLENGAHNQLWAATAPKDKVESGNYYTPVGKKAGGSYMTGYARDEKLADKLWEWTEEELKKHGYS